MPDPDRFSIPVSVFVSVSLSQHLLTNKKKNPLSLVGQRVSCGAVEQIRTADLVIINYLPAIFSCRRLLVLCVLNACAPMGVAFTLLLFAVSCRLVSVAVFL